MVKSKKTGRNSGGAFSEAEEAAVSEDSTEKSLTENHVLALYLHYTDVTCCGERTTGFSELVFQLTLAIQL